VRLRK